MKSLVAGIIIAAFTVLGIHFSVVSAVRVTGNDLAPDFRQNDLVIVSRMAYGNLTRGTPHRGDAAWLKDQSTGTFFFARILALPGDWVEVRQSRLFINGKTSNTPRSSEKQNMDSIADLKSPAALSMQNLSVTLADDQFFTNHGIVILKSIKGKVIGNLSR